ncbi:MAG: hypothetical protein Unbinned4311contig1001_22 [Prokaryotic dsDNA virus sp.]|nr:MAG: hypothetical protein Unbinned4311contig1001_22 [Prokaryotic dsDNA virus sp.]
MTYITTFLSGFKRLLNLLKQENKDVAHVNQSDQVINLDEKLNEVQLRRELLEIQLELETQGVILEEVQRQVAQNNNLLKVLVSIFTPHEKN